jgi:lysophospholipase L1-like esterase
MVRPVRIFLLLLLVNVLLGACIYCFPSGNIRLTNGITLKFLPLDELLNKKEIKYANVASIVAEKPKVNIDSAVAASLVNKKADDSSATPLVDLQSLLQLRYRIQYPDSSKNSLSDFFNQLDVLGKDKNYSVRVVHYGDSQIEGDRITGTLRDKLQNEFGGYGAGTVPVFDVADIRSSVSISTSPNWKKFAVYGGLYKSAKTNLFGMQGAFFRIITPKDTNGQVISGAKEGWVQFRQSYTGYPGTRHFDELKLYYARVTSKVTVSIYEKNKKVLTDTLRPVEDFSFKSWPVNNLENNIKIVFTTDGKLDVYGIGFDSKSGIDVDNVAMRGSSGLDLSKIRIAYLAQQLNFLNTKLLILQYGVNLAPYDVPSYDFYEKSFYNELKKLKDNLSGVSILVVGISDVSKNENGQYVTSPNVIKIRDAQKKAAFKAGCAFWDLFEAMGGENSMPGWVTAKPELAQKDYTHFSPKGARIVGNMLYNALMAEYIVYKTHAQN